MRRHGVTVSLLVAIVLAASISISLAAGAKPPSRPEGFAGSVSCRECHEKFYQLWSTSFHGLALQPYTPEFARTKLTAHTKEIAVNGFTYRAEIGGNTGYVLENREGAVKTLRDTLKRHPAHVDAALLLGEIYEQEGKKEGAKEIYRKALSGGELSDRDSLRLRAKLQALEGKEKGKKK